MEIFDTHTHLNTREFEGRIQDELVQAQTFGVTRINNVGSNYELNDAALLLAEKFEECYATIGWHPDDAAEFDDQAENYLLTKLSAKKVIALGEIGLDYHWMVRPKKNKNEFLEDKFRFLRKWVCLFKFIHVMLLMILMKLLNQKVLVLLVRLCIRFLGQLMRR